MARPLPFAKYHGLGNDFVLLDAVRDAWITGVGLLAEARAMCDRRTGVGADGVLVVLPDAGADAAMRIINADGSDGGMCGNGLRCIAKHMVERHGRGASLRIRTSRGMTPIECDVAGGVMRSARVDMGPPALIPGEIPVRAPGDRAVWVGVPPEAAHACSAAGIEPFMTCVGMGNPHAVLFCADAPGAPVEAIGAMLERHPMFPERTNVQFVQRLGESQIRLRTWERGAGVTAACGTGACAAVVAGVLRGVLARRVDVALDRGGLTVEWDGASGRVFKAGPAERVFEGEWLMGREG